MSSHRGPLLAFLLAFFLAILSPSAAFPSLRFWGSDSRFSVWGQARFSILTLDWGSDSRFSVGQKGRFSILGRAQEAREGA